MRRLGLAWMAAVGGLVCRVADAAEKFKPPELEKKFDWIALAIAVVALAAICLVAFKNAGRGNQN